MISPSFSDEKLDSPSLEDLIDVFEDRVRWWVLEPARALLDIPHGFVSAVCLLLTYFESYSIYYRGKDSSGQSKLFFREGFCDVFRNAKVNPTFLARVSDALYGDARCGFFHDGIFRDRILFSENFDAEFVVTVPRVGGKPDEAGSIESILINPRSFAKAVEAHFVAYVKALRDTNNASLRTNFEAAVNTKWSPGTSVVIGMAESEFNPRKTT